MEYRTQWGSWWQMPLLVCKLSVALFNVTSNYIFLLNIYFWMWNMCRKFLTQILHSGLYNCLLLRYGCHSMDHNVWGIVPYRIANMGIWHISCLFPSFWFWLKSTTHNVILEQVLLSWSAGGPYTFVLLQLINSSSDKYCNALRPTGCLKINAESDIRIAQVGQQFQIT